MNCQFLQECIDKSIHGESKLSKDVLNIPGMSGLKNRHFLNNLFSIGGLSYLEVGCWRGSTACSALFENNLSQAVLVDNFSEFNDGFTDSSLNVREFVDVKKDLESNLNNFCKDQYVFIDSDFFSLDISSYRKFDIFFYDGCHDYESQYKALSYALPYLKDTFVFLVDDHHFDVVKNATNDSISKIVNRNEVEILCSHEFGRELPIEQNWWHGFYIGLFRKNEPLF